MPKRYEAKFHRPGPKPQEPLVRFTANFLTILAAFHFRGSQHHLMSESWNQHGRRYAAESGRSGATKGPPATKWKYARVDLGGGAPDVD
jgi:hypothetical protein